MIYSYNFSNKRVHDTQLKLNCLIYKPLLNYAESWTVSHFKKALTTGHLHTARRVSHEAVEVTVSPEIALLVVMSDKTFFLGAYHEDSSEVRWTFKNVHFQF